MARKKSRGAKKARSRKARPPESGRDAASSDAAEVDAPDTAGEGDGADGPAGKKEKKPAGNKKKKPAGKKKQKEKKAPDGASKPEGPGKKKKKRKKKARRTKKGAGTESSGTVAGEPPPEEPTLDDATPELTVDELVAATAALGDEVEPVPIDVDEEDGDARAQLIAETLALVAAEAGEETDGGAAGILELADELRKKDASEDEPLEGGADAPDATATEPDGDAAADDGAGDGAGESEDEEAEARPLIGAQAYLALSEIHAEGLARLPEELILDLGDASTPQERDRLLAAALAHAEMQEAIYRVPTGSNRARRIKLGVAALIALVALGVGLRPPALLVPESPPPLRVADRVHGVHVSLLLQAQQIEAYRVANGALPRSLDDVPVRLPGIRYVRSTSRAYQLVGYSPRGEAIVFDSTAPAPAFEQLAGPWSTRTEAS